MGREGFKTPQIGDDARAPSGMRSALQCMASIATTCSGKWWPNRVSGHQLALSTSSGHPGSSWPRSSKLGAVSACLGARVEARDGRTLGQGQFDSNHSNKLMDNKIQRTAFRPQLCPVGETMDMCCRVSQADGQRAALTTDSELWGRRGTSLRTGERLA